MNHQSDLIEVYGGNIIESGMVKSLLENAGISAFLKDEIMGTMNPWWVAPGGAGAVKVMISTVDFEKGKLIVAAYEAHARHSSET